MATERRSKGTRWTRRLERVGVWSLLILFAAVFSLPLLITLSDSLKTFPEIYASPRVWIPKVPQWSNFVEIFEALPMLRFFLNTFAITLLALAGQLFSACVVGYSFARLRWPLRDFCFVVLLATMMLPYQITMIPIYLLFTKLQWVNTWLPLIVPAYFGGSVFNIFLMRQFFKTIPVALEDAAIVDGCSYARMFTTIMLPLAKPAIITIAILSFVYHWNDFLNPLIYLSDFELYPISLGIHMFRDSQMIFPHYVMAASLLALLPVLLLFLAAQRYFVEGIALTGTKG
jgi:multiple sugar transport system permease protein